MFRRRGRALDLVALAEPVLAELAGGERNVGGERRYPAVRR
jgi:hypothetical protein